MTSAEPMKRSEHRTEGRELGEKKIMSRISLTLATHTQPIFTVDDSSRLHTFS